MGAIYSIKRHLRPAADWHILGRLLSVWNADVLQLKFAVRPTTQLRRFPWVAVPLT